MRTIIGEQGEKITHTLDNLTIFMNTAIDNLRHVNNMESRFSSPEKHTKQDQIGSMTDAASNRPADYDPLSNTDVTIIAIRLPTNHDTLVDNETSAGWSRNHRSISHICFGF